MSDEARRGDREEVGSAWQSGLPLSEMKQQVSLTFVHLVAATAGCWLKSHTTDYDSVDITKASSEDHELFFGTQFELQMKCTSQRNVVHDDHIAWSMEGKPYRKLTNPKRYLPAFLGILEVPEDPSLWLKQDEQSFLSIARPDTGPGTPGELLRHRTSPDTALLISAVDRDQRHRSNQVGTSLLTAA